MKVNFKKLSPDAAIPTKAHPSDAGFDITAIAVGLEAITGNLVYYTGIAVEIPEGYVGLLFPRSSISEKSQMLTNSVGVIDSGYRGEITFKFKPKQAYNSGLYYEASQYKVGERVGQLIIIPYPEVEFVETEELSPSDRGKSGYGSSGK